MEHIYNILHLRSCYIKDVLHVSVSPFKDKDNYDETLR